MIGRDTSPLLWLARVAGAEVVNRRGSEDEIVIYAAPIGPPVVHQRVAHGAFDRFRRGTGFGRVVVEDAEAIALREVVIELDRLHVAVEDLGAHGEVVARLLRRVWDR